MSERITLRARGQITLPLVIRKAAGLEPGQLLEVEYHAGSDTIRLWPVGTARRSDVALSVAGGPRRSDV